MRSGPYGAPEGTKDRASVRHPMTPEWFRVGAASHAARSQPPGRDARGWQATAPDEIPWLQPRRNGKVREGSNSCTGRRGWAG
jgi:hypothetical protein